MELTNSERAKVFAIYLGCEVYTPLIKEPEINIGVLYADVPYGSQKWHLLTDKCSNGEYAYLPNYYLKLTPLNKITLEDAIWVAKIANCFYATPASIKLDYKMSGMPTPEPFAQLYTTYHNGSENERDIILNISKGDVTFCSGNAGFETYCNVHQFLISRHYAVPLFFAPGHWANGKDAIKLNIAIDKTPTPFPNI